MNSWRKQHGQVIKSFMKYLNSKTDSYVLKGGTALFLCYCLDRFSEDIDLDGIEKGMPPLVNDYCSGKGYSYRIAKDTGVVERCFIDYGALGKPLKIEASYRRASIPEEETVRINGIRTYTIESLCIMKVNAYAGRDKIRDLYDLAFIFNNYYEELSSKTISYIRSAVEYKGIEQFDYIVQNQPDDLINSEKLADDFLSMYDRLGLLLDDSERELLTNGSN